MKNQEVVIKPVCESCLELVDIWNNDIVTDAWQKHSFNHYQYNCPYCGDRQRFSIEIQKD